MTTLPAIARWNHGQAAHESTQRCYRAFLGYGNNVFCELLGWNLNAGFKVDGKGLFYEI